jgi:hypothetical protein
LRPFCLQATFSPRRPRLPPKLQARRPSAQGSSRSPELRFAIRDDDTSFLTTPHDLEAAYEGIWNVAPVSLAVIPFVGWRYVIARMLGARLERRDICRVIRDIECGGGPPEFKRVRDQWSQPRFIGENEELVRFLRGLISAGRVSILLHGFLHDVYATGYEFEVGQDLAQKVAYGKRLIEELFGVQVSTFVPPFNRISSVGVEAIVAQGLNVLTSRIPRLRERRLASWTLGTVLRVALAKARGWGIPVVFSPLHFRGHSELRCWPLTASLDYLKDVVRVTAERGGTFCVYTHYYQLSRDHALRSKLLDLISSASGSRVRFARVDDLWWA